MTTTERLREVEKEMPPAPLRTAECKTGANCWCRMVVGENGDEFIPAGFMRKTEAEFLVATRNALPAMLAVIDAAEEYTTACDQSVGEKLMRLQSALAAFREVKG